MPMDRFKPVVKLPPPISPTTQLQHAESRDSKWLHKSSTSIDDFHGHKHIHFHKSRHSGRIGPIRFPCINLVLRKLYQLPISNHPQRYHSIHHNNTSNHSTNKFPSRSMATITHTIPCYILEILLIQVKASTGTPLSQIPERAIHAQPFQPNHYQQQSQNYYPQAIPSHAPTTRLLLSTNFNPSMAQSAGAAPFVPSQPHSNSRLILSNWSATGCHLQAQNLVAQEVNGMVYYYDATQIPAVATFPAYQQPQSYPMQPVGGVGGMLPDDAEPGWILLSSTTSRGRLITQQ